MNIHKRVRRGIQYKAKNAWYRLLTRNYQLPGGYRRIYHYHIQKTGGTSINHMFLNLSGKPGEQVYNQISSLTADQGSNESPQYRVTARGMVFVGWKKYIIEQGYYFYAFSHLTAHELQLPPQTFTLTCLRDPVKRVISHYRHLLTHRESHGLKPEVNGWLRSTFQESLVDWPNHYLLSHLHMFSPNYDVDEAAERICQVDAILFTEEMAEGVARLAQRLNLDLQVQHFMRSN
ncbi:MAG: sulfotransferase family 2 domain-containing protein, partial [Taibaiella sp.]|nr:sulfotransferase family 2 domain-containing protein [Taibaiella sp.]